MTSTCHWFPLLRGLKYLEYKITAPCLERQVKAEQVVKILIEEIVSSCTNRMFRCRYFCHTMIVFVSIYLYPIITYRFYFLGYSIVKCRIFIWEYKCLLSKNRSHGSVKLLPLVLKQFFSRPCWRLTDSVPLLLQPGNGVRYMVLLGVYLVCGFTFTVFILW